MPKFLVGREVREWLEVEAKDDYEADDIANETPIEEWERDIKSFTVGEVSDE